MIFALFFPLPITAVLGVCHPNAPTHVAFPNEARLGDWVSCKYCGSVRTGAQPLALNGKDPV